MKAMTVIGVLLFMSGLLALVSNRKHTLNMLLSLEYMTLSVSWMIFNMFNYISGEYYMMLYFFVFVVCEGALGLSLVVVLIRTCGSDLILNMNMLEY